MTRKFTSFIFALIYISLYPCIAFADLNLITWKGTYYAAVPNKKSVSLKYCKEHMPGTFIHVVKDALAHPVYTDRGIKLDRATFSIEKIHGIYLIHGDLWATGKTKNEEWQDHIYYYFSKLTEAGVTKGVWSSDKCKGLWVAYSINNKNQQKSELS